MLLEVLLVLLEVSDCGTVLLLALLLGWLLWSGVLALGLVALGFDGFDDSSGCGVVLWLGVLGVAEGCWSGVVGVVGVLWLCGVVLCGELELGLLDCAKATAAERMSARNKLFFIGIPTPGFGLAILCCDRVSRIRCPWSRRCCHPVRPSTRPKQRCANMRRALDIIEGRTDKANLWEVTEPDYHEAKLRKPRNKWRRGHRSSSRKRRKQLPHADLRNCRIGRRSITDTQRLCPDSSLCLCGRCWV